MSEFSVKKIMIVEDDPVNQKVMQRLVKILGHEIIALNDGYEVIGRIRAERPDLILMDIQLIEISGIDITRRIKEDEQLKSIPVIAVTASAMLQDREKVLRESKSDDYLEKPFSPKELGEKIARFFPVKKVDL